MSNDVWHVPSDDDPTEIVEIHPVTITPRPLPPTGTGPVARMIRDMELADWQKRLLELLVEAKRTNSRIVMAQGRHGPHWTLEPMRGRVKVGKATVSWGPRTYGPDTVIANAPVEAIDDLAAAVLQAQIQLRGQP